MNNFSSVFRNRAMIYISVFGLLYFATVLVFYAQVDSVVAAAVEHQLNEIDVGNLLPHDKASATDFAKDQGWFLDDDRRVSYVNWLDSRHDSAHFDFPSLASIVDKLKLSSDGRESDRPKKRRICIVTWEYEELITSSGGIGTAFTALARTLAHAGHNVTVLINRDDPVDYAANVLRGFDEWQELIFRRDGVRVEVTPRLPFLDKVKDRCGFTCMWSYNAFRWLADRDGDFDMIHFHDNAGYGYYTALAKRQKSFFQSTLLIVGAHGPHFWERKANRLYLSETLNLEADYLERQTIEWSDYLLSPSNFILDWMLRQGWRLPPVDRVAVIQNIMPLSKEELEKRLKEKPLQLTPEQEEALKRRLEMQQLLADVNQPQARQHQQLDLDQQEVDAFRRDGIAPNGLKRIVFFGRHETRKGLAVFMDAVMSLNATLNRHNIEIIFLGSSAIVSNIASQQFIPNHCAEANLNCVELTELGRAAAAQHLLVPGTLTVVASLTENSPYTVLECLGVPLPFLASRVGGIPELIDPNDHERVLFSPIASILASRIVDVIEKGLRPPKYSVSPQVTEQTFIDWHSLVPLASPPSVDAPADVSVTIAVAHLNEPDLLEHTLVAARSVGDAFKLGSVNIVVCDAGSDQASTTRVQQLADDDVRVLRPPASERGATLTAGATRNACAEAARGDFVLFVDAGDVPLPGSLDALVGIAVQRGAVAVTAVSRVVTHAGLSIGGNSREAHELMLYTGCGYLGDGLGLFHNCYGGVNALVSRRAFLAVGGYRRDEYGVDSDPHALYAALTLAGGLLEVAASAPLVEQRTPRVRLPVPRFGVAVEPVVARTRQLRPFAAVMHPTLRTAAMFSLDLYSQFKEIGKKNKRYYDERVRAMAAEFVRRKAELEASGDGAAPTPRHTEL